MIEKKTAKGSIRVNNDRMTGPYISVPIELVPEVVRLLNENQIENSVDKNAVSLDGGKTYTAFVNINYSKDVDRVRKLLDSENGFTNGSQG